MKNTVRRSVSRGWMLVLTLGFAAYGQAPPRIAQPIDDSKLMVLAGNTRPEANAANDRGRVDDGMPLPHLLLQLRRAPEIEQKLEQKIDRLHDPKSPDYHQWLTPAAFGREFGLAQQDLGTIRKWLESKGFTVNGTYPNGMVVDFSGTAGQVRSAFRTEIHHLSVNGQSHIGNMSNPQIPEALAPAISGIVSLHDFRPHANYVKSPNFAGGLVGHAVGGADLAIIYNLTPLFDNNITGQGVSLAVIEDADLAALDDWSRFRQAFGLDKFTSGNLIVVHPPSAGVNCPAPGVSLDSIEAELDTQFASAAAPNATIQAVSCANMATTWGGMIALDNLLNTASPPIVSISYGECEAYNGAAQNAAFYTAYQQAVAEGISIFVASGDSGAAGCDPQGMGARHGIGVSALASTPYNVAVGGTDFADTYLGTAHDFWRKRNTKDNSSAKSYIPEIPWNQTCASTLIAQFNGYPQTYGTTGFCNSRMGENFYLANGGGGGGPSACAYGAPAHAGDVGGTCQGYAKPSWQSGLVGNPNDGVRDTPDLSLFAAAGAWNQSYIICYSQFQDCSKSLDHWLAAGGTSFASPIMAGILALVNQLHGPQGNPNYALYAMAAQEYGTQGSAACNSTATGGAASDCIFYDITLGDITMACRHGGLDCYRPSGAFGVLSTKRSSYEPAYPAGTGWDFATGIGSVNAANLVNNWKTVAP